MKDLLLHKDNLNNKNSSLQLIITIMVYHHHMQTLQSVTLIQHHSSNKFKHNNRIKIGQELMAMKILITISLMLKHMRKKYRNKIMLFNNKKGLRAKQINKEISLHYKSQFKAKLILMHLNKDSIRWEVHKQLASNNQQLDTINNFLNSNKQ